jgi:hypothetical protein
MNDYILRISHAPTELIVEVQLGGKYRSKYLAKEYATRILKSKIAALKRGGYVVVNGELKEIAELNNPLIVETGTVREENEY